jgi:hypothetical protein
MSSVSPVPPAVAPRDRTASVFLAAILIAAALTGVATLSAAGSGALQEVLRFAGYGRTTAIQSEQQRQADVLAKLERVVDTISTGLGAVALRADAAAGRQSDLGERLARLDGDIGALREALVRRPKPGDPPNVWREAMFESDRVLHGAMMDLASLRSSIDTNDAAQRKEFAAIHERLNRLESAVSIAQIGAPPAAPAPQAAGATISFPDDARTMALRGSTEAGAVRRTDRRPAESR